MLKESSFYLIAAILANIIQFISLPFFTTYLTPSHFGVIALSAMVASIFSGLASIGLQQATFRFFFKKEVSDNFTSINLTNIISLVTQFSIVFSIVYLYADLIASNILSNNFTKDLLLLSLIQGAILYIYNYLLYLLVAKKEALKFLVLSVLLSVLNVVIPAILILNYNMTYLSKIYGVICSCFLLSLVMFYILRNLFIGKFSRKYLLMSLRYSFPTLPGAMISIGFQSFDKTMLNSYRDLSSVGYYDISNKFASVFKTISDAINKPWQPFFLEQSEEQGGGPIIVERFYYILSITMVVALGVTYFSEEVIKILTNESYYFAIYIVPIMVVSYLIGDMTANIYMNQIVHKERLFKQIPVSLLGLSVNVLLNFLLIPLYGVIGAAIATLITVILQSVYGLFLGNRLYKLPFDIYKILKLALVFSLFIANDYLMISFESNILIKMLIKIILIVAFIMILMKILNVTWLTLTSNFNWRHPDAAS